MIDDYVQNGWENTLLGFTIMGKYITLIEGIYNVTKDNPDFGLAIKFGAGYALAEGIQKAMEQYHASKRFDTLEKN